MSVSESEVTRIHPRRRPFMAAPSSVAAGQSPNPQNPSPSGSPAIRLRKGETFHSPTSPPSEDRDPLLDFRSLPRRSPTCTKSLEDIAAGEERIIDILGNLSLDSTDSPNSDNSRVGDDLPVPTAIVQAHIRASANTDAPDASTTNSPPSLSPSSPMNSPKKAWNDTFHASDSGLGSSVSSADSEPSSCQKQVKTRKMSCAQGTQSAITSSIQTIEPESAPKRKLGPVACKQIERFVLVPLLKEERLKTFHPLVRSIPHRIAGREIGCLRDLEKAFLGLTRRSVDRGSFIDFWEVTIRCLHTSTSHLNDRDQRLPADRPYTNGYFLDLIDQLRRHAATMSTRVNQESKESTAKADASKSEHLSLEGGLAKTGRPAEFVVRKGDEATSLRTGEPYQSNATPTFKRSVSVNSVDEGVERSMARRKKNAPPMNIDQKCLYCDKRFKRPCDHKKHEKTHTRPAKCPVPTCKYHTIGWANEKERDRHFNDKHCKTPTMFQCTDPDCTYQSKRETNCKQHMEKAHGKPYERTKGNGKQGSKLTSLTPSDATPASRMADLPTPSTGPSLSPPQASMHYPQEPAFTFAAPPAQTGSGDFELYAGNNIHGDPSNGLHGFGAFDTLQTQFESVEPQGLIPALDMQRQSFDSSVPDLIGTSMGVDGSPVASTDNANMGVGVNWNNLDASNRPALNGGGEYTTMHMQVESPVQDPSTSSASPPPIDRGQIYGLSPGAPGNLMLYTPNAEYPDEDMSDLYVQDKSKNDFTLYESTNQGMGVTMPTDTGGVEGFNSMFPSVDDDCFYVNQWYPGQQAMTDTPVFPMELDTGLAG